MEEQTEDERNPDGTLSECAVKAKGPQLQGWELANWFRSFVLGIKRGKNGEKNEFEVNLS